MPPLPQLYTTHISNSYLFFTSTDDDDEADADEDDDLEEIDPDNIVPTGRRTRGKVIDFAKAAAAAPLDDDEDEDEDDDYEAPGALAAGGDDEMEH